MLSLQRQGGGLCRFPDAPHGISADGGASGPNSRSVSDSGAAEWDAPQPQVLRPVHCFLSVPQRLRNHSKAGFFQCT